MTASAHGGSTSAESPAPVVIGLLYPGHDVAEDDYPWLSERLFEDGSVRVDVVETSMGEDVHTVEALMETGSDWRLDDGLRRLEPNVRAVVWACTSGSFVFGWEGARQQAERLETRTGCPASSTSLAFVAALAALGVRRVSVAATYPAPLAERFIALLADAGVEVSDWRPQGIFTAALAGDLGRDETTGMVRAADRPDAEAVLVPDTALHGAQWVPEIERELGKPVLTANQVTLWEGLRLAHVAVDAPQLGTIFATAPRVQPAR